MLIKCDLCGGENELLPGQRMLKCSYCGSSLAVEEERFEHLILPHRRNDKIAKQMLRSFLVRRDCGKPGGVEIEFSYVPFSVIEDKTGGTSCLPAEGTPPEIGPLADIPAGDYSFFDEKLASGERMIRPRNRDERASMLIHVPVYILRFSVGKESFYATVIGESWYVQMDEIPPSRKGSLDFASLIPAAGLFVAYLLIGRLGAGVAARVAYIAAAAAALFFAYKIKKKVAAGNEG